MRNFIYSSFSSQRCSLAGNGQVQLPRSDVSISSSSVCGSSFFRDSQVCNDQHLGSFAPLSSIDILHPPNLNYLHPPPGLQTSPAAMNETVSHPGTARISHMRHSVDQFVEAEPFRNESKLSIVTPDMSSPPMNNCGSEFENSRKRKAISAEDDQQQHPTDEPPLGTRQQEQRVPVRRSQKIGDRITALQKLVSPFGKTDTASVLQEASAYIKLLQEQIQMLSTPYFRVESLPQQAFGGRLTDLRSRGLCLVPVSFTRSIINQNRAVDRSISRRTVIHRNY